MVIWKAAADVHYDDLSRHYITRFWMNPLPSLCPVCWHLFKIQPLIFVPITCHQAIMGHCFHCGEGVIVLKTRQSLVEALNWLCVFGLQTGNLLASWTERLLFYSNILLLMLWGPPNNTAQATVCALVCAYVRQRAYVCTKSCEIKILKVD